MLGYGRSNLTTEIVAMNQTAGKEPFIPFAGEKYLSFESYRKNGAAIRTPMWFAEGDGVLYVYSLADAAKVKRVRNNPRVRIAPCDVRGKVTGEWVDGTATILDETGAARGHECLNAKYGWMIRLGHFFSVRVRHRKRAVMAIRL